MNWTELRGAEELLQRRRDRPDVHDRLRRDRVLVLGRQALAHHPLHPVEADPERLLDQLAHRAQAAVAEVLVLVEVVLGLAAGDDDRVGGEVLRVLGHAQLDRQRHEPAHQLDDVAGGEHAALGRDVQAEAHVQLVAADLGQVVALGVEEERAHEVARVLERRRLARALLLEHLDQRLLLALGRVLLERHADEGVVLEQRQQALVGLVDVEAGVLVGLGQRAQERRHRQLALAVDADVDHALLVDLHLEPRAARRHQVGDEHLLGRVLRLHDVGARRAHQLRHDDALGAVDDERALLGHPGEVAEEHGLLADLARVEVRERHLHVHGHLEGLVLLAALALGHDRIADGVLAQPHLEPLGVVADRRDVVDRLAQARDGQRGRLGGIAHEPPEGGLLDIDQVGDVQHLLELGEGATASGRMRACRQSVASRGASGGNSEGVEPDQRRNHEGYQHDRFPANADTVAAARREFSPRNSTCRGVPVAPLYPLGRRGQVDCVAIVTVTADTPMVTGRSPGRGDRLRRGPGRRRPRTAGRPPRGTRG